MVRFDLFLFGYRRIAFPKERTADIGTLFLRSGISARINGGSAFIKASSYHLIENKLPAGAECSELLGLPYYLKKCSRAYGVLAAIFILSALYALTAGIVWEIRIDGNDEVTRESIIEELDAAGFSVGKRFSKIDTSEVESSLLRQSDNISWISINRRGSVAYVNVIEKMSGEEQEEKSGYANIVAEYDAVIEEITVVSGYATVKVGEAVKKGDLLISGVIPDELGGGFVYAEGTVLGRRVESVGVTVPFSEETVSYSERELKSVSLKIFDFSVNIFKKYGNTDESCDIIVDVEEYVLFGKYRLPFSLNKVYSREANSQTTVYSSENITKIASSRLNERVRQALSSRDLVSIRSEGGFTDSGYTMSSRLTVVSEIGKSVAFSVGEK